MDTERYKLLEYINSGEVRLEITLTLDTIKEIIDFEIKDKFTMVMNSSENRLYTDDLLRTCWGNVNDELLNIKDIENLNMFLYRYYRMSFEEWINSLPFSRTGC